MGWFLMLVLGALGQAQHIGCPLRNTLNYHNSTIRTVRSFQGVYGSNFNETITFCDFKLKSFELNEWKVIPVLAQSADSGQSQYNDKGAMLTGGVYLAPNGSVIWKGLGFSANGPYDCAFALAGNGSEAVGYYTFLEQLNASTPAGETGPWLLYYEREPTTKECASVYREHGCGSG